MTTHYITADLMAKYGVCERTVQRWASRDGAPHHIGKSLTDKCRSRFMFPCEAFDAWAKVRLTGVVRPGVVEMQRTIVAQAKEIAELREALSLKLG